MPEPLIIHLRTGDELRCEADRAELSAELAERPFIEVHSGGKFVSVFSRHVVWLEPVRESGPLG